MPSRNPTPFDALKPLAGRALQEVLNRALALDPDAGDDLRALEGRRVELALVAPPLAMSVTARDGRLQVGPAIDNPEADLSVRGTLGGLLSQFDAFRPRDGAAPGSLRVSGDAELARRLRTLLRDFDPDWERPFADAFGEVLGARIAGTLRGALRTGRGLASGLARDVADYLGEERGEIATGVELEIFNDDVDCLRDDVDRMARRVARLREAGHDSR